MHKVQAIYHSRIAQTIEKGHGLLDRENFNDIKQHQHSKNLLTSWINSLSKHIARKQYSEVAYTTSHIP